MAELVIRDVDGDTLTVSTLGEVFTACIAGEDGHRTVVLTGADIDTLATFLISTRNGGVV